MNSNGKFFLSEKRQIMSDNSYQQTFRERGTLFRENGKLVKRKKFLPLHVTKRDISMRHRYTNDIKVEGEVSVRQVLTRREQDDFVRFPARLYGDNEFYVPDMDTDIRAMFQPKDNVMLESSEIAPFIAYDGKGDTVGRIVGIINHKANAKWNTRKVRFGQIEFVDDTRVSAAILQAVEQWGRQRGMDMIEGPMGIFDFDKEGMLIDDFDRKGSMIAIYNPPYYPRHMEALGYAKEVDWVHIRIDVPKTVPARYRRVAQLAREMMGLRVRKLTAREFRREGYGERLFALLNSAYAPLFGYTELSERQVQMFMERYIPLIDCRMLPVVENDKGEMVGAAVTMGSLSDALRKSGGRLLPFGWFHLLRALKWHHESTADMLLVAVRPDYQGMGVNALFFDDLIPVYNQLGYTSAETGPQLESNIKELSQWKPLNPQTIKRRRCFCKDITR